MNKIFLTLTNEELVAFQALVNKNATDRVSALVNLQIDKEDSDEFIKQRVFLALSDLSGLDIQTIEQGQQNGNDADLKLDLGLSLHHKKSLKSYFDSILADLKSTKIVTVKECESLAKVSECLKLVKSKL